MDEPFCDNMTIFFYQKLRIFHLITKNFITGSESINVSPENGMKMG